MNRTPPPPLTKNMVVGTRSASRREREQEAQQVSTSELREAKEVPNPPPTEGSVRRTRSSASSVKVRRARLQLDAARKKADLEMLQLEAAQEAARKKADLEIDIINKTLALDLVELEEQSGSEKDGPSHHYDEKSVDQWIKSSQQEATTQCAAVLDRTHTEPALQQRPTAVLPTNTSETMHMLATALKNLTAATSASCSSVNPKLVNRLCTPKDLPNYYGDPLEWLHFKQAYEESSQVCNFTDQENLWRLRKSLHGRAKEAVTALLIGATTPEVVMSTLQLQFGNPDVIINRILQDIYKLRPVSQEYQKDIVPFSIKIKNCVAAVSAMNCEDYMKGMNIVSIVVSKLPTILMSKWTDYSFSLINENTKPKLVILSEFLSAEAQKVTQCSVNLSYVSNYNKNSYNQESQSVLITSNNDQIHDSVNCGFCKTGNHALTECRKFKKALRHVRWAHVKRRRICFKCLVASHNKETCPASACDIEDCGQAHHRLLHYSPNKNKQELSKLHSVPETSDEIITYIKFDNRRVLLKTVPVIVHGPNGRSRSVALLDDGSTVTLISSTLASRVGLHGLKQSMRVTGAWNNTDLVCDSEIISLDISNSNGNRFTMKARSVENMDLPMQNIASVNIDSYDLKPKITNVITDEQCKPEILIGQDNYHLILPLEIIKAKPHEPYFTRTPLGWCIHGCVRSSADTSNLQSTLFTNEESSTSLEAERILKDIYEEIRQSYAIDSVGISAKPRRNIDDVRAWDHLENTSKFIEGRWYVRLPWKDMNSCMPHSYANAFNRLRGVEKKMKLSAGYSSRYQERIDHLTTNDYASRIEVTGSSKRTWYLELQAALIGTRLAETVIKEHKIKAVKKFMWCDSATVLHWIRNDRRTYKAYIAHRLGEIDEYSQMSEWRYIPTKINVADVATREDCEIKTLESAWLYGPLFLHENESLWPMESETEVQLPDVSDVDLECVNTLHVKTLCLPDVPDPKRFSSWLRLLRTTSVILSFIDKCKKLKGDIDGAMMKRSEALLIRFSQLTSFPEATENSKRTRYMPHFGVENPNTQKLRLVFAAARYGGVCLNDYLLKGPDLLISLYGTMLRFRVHKVAVTGGIRDLRIKIILHDTWRPRIRMLVSECLKLKPRPLRRGSQHASYVP